MPANVEIKARVRDLARITALVKALTSTASQLIEQEDIFFHVPRGRLKLRILRGYSGELIYYEREDRTGPRVSQYSISRTSEPDSLKAVLQASLGIRGVVKTRRTLYLAGQTRIHLDEVEGLGTFVELEVVMREGQSREDGVKVARDLMERLEIMDSVPDRTGVHRSADRKSIDLDFPERFRLGKVAIECHSRELGNPVDS